MNDIEERDLIGVSAGKNAIFDKTEKLLEASDYDVNF